MKKDDGTPVVFRMLKSGQVIALMPEKKDSSGNCVTVKIVVKKSMVSGMDSYKSIIRYSRLARPSEIEELLAHLQGTGMNVSVRKKWSKKDEKKG